MRFIIPTFEKIEWMPPTITLFNKLVSMGHQIVYITIYPDYYFTDDKIQNVCLYKKNICLQSKLPYTKGVSGILWRIDTLIKKIISHRLNKKINELMDENSFLWVVNEMTVMYAGVSFLKNRDYFFTVYELHNKNFANRNIIKAAGNAKKVIVPEYCRAHIMKANYNLSKVPFVLPNKSDLPENQEPNEESKRIINELKALKNNKKKLILYMGGINKERPLELLLNAIEGSPEYKLVILGRSSPYLDELKSHFSNIHYLGYLKPPHHLDIVKYVDIGVVLYVPINDSQALNAIFCAPNKIYEYSGNGIPILSNDIPALRLTIGNYKCGELADFSDSDDILRAISNIEDNYSEYSENALKFYADTDIDKLLLNLLSD